MQDIKQAYQSAKKELDEESKRKLIDQMKVYIKNTLQAIEDKKAEVAQKQQELKALKADLEDLKEGRLEKIKERQDKDIVAKRVSVINITYIINNYPWIVPYFQPIYHYYQPYQPNIVVNTVNTLQGINSNSGSNMIGYCSSNNLMDKAVNALEELYSENDISGTYTINGVGGLPKAYYI